MKRLVLIILAAVPLVVFAQQASLSKIESGLLYHFNRLDQWTRGPYTNATTDSIIHEDSILISKMLHVLNTSPITLTARLDSLQAKGLIISSSSDKKFRIYSWDDGSGGTMRFFNVIIQYQTAKGVKAILYHPGDASEQDTPNFFYRNVYPIKKGNQTYYLATRTAIFSSRDSYHGLKIFRIDNNRLNDTASLIKTGTGIRNELGYEYDFTSVMHIDYEKRPQITFDKKTNTLFIPLVTEEGKVTSKLIRYKFDGKYFVRM